MKRVNYLITEENIIVNFDGLTITVNVTSKKKYDHLKELIKKDDEEGIIEFLKPSEKIVKYANDYFFVDERGYLYVNDEPESALPGFMSVKLMDFINEDLDIKPIINFWKRLRKNPSKESQEDLYEFLTKHKHPLTPDGCFIAYKKVTKVKGKLMDSHTKTMDNSIGKKVTMKRFDVNPDRNQTCSTGLHVASLNYAKGFSGDVLVEVLVDPVDVVVVPKDYNSEKMRTCGYTVLNEVKLEDEKRDLKPSKREELLKKLPTDSKPITRKKKEIKTDVEQQIEKELTVDLGKMTAKDIIAEVLKKTGTHIDINPKNKKTVVKRAKDILAKQGFNVIE